MSRRQHLPSYRLHKARNLAVVRLNGKDHYLGPYDSPESWEKYHRLLAEHLAGTPTLPESGSPGVEPISIKRLCLAYSEFADTYYVRDGAKTAEVDFVTYALRPLIKLYGESESAYFGPKALKLVRDEFVRAGQCRITVNNNVARIKRLFRWAVENELVPPSVHHGLSAVAGLRKGRGSAPESEPVQPVDDALVDATLPRLPEPVQAMVRLQRLTGCRPGEICQMRPCDVDQTRDVWCYRPATHKTDRYGFERRIFLGPRAQEILRPWLDRKPTDYCFVPAEFCAKRNAGRKEQRRSPMTPSQSRRRRKASPRRAPGKCYTPASYRRAVARGCLVAKIDSWSPNQLRHTRATELRRLHGLDAAQVILGHSEAFVTEIYAAKDFALAEQIMREAG